MLCDKKCRVKSPRLKMRLSPWKCPYLCRSHAFWTDYSSRWLFRLPVFSDLLFFFGWWMFMNPYTFIYFWDLLTLGFWCFLYSFFIAIDVNSDMDVVICRKSNGITKGHPAHLCHVEINQAKHLWGFILKYDISLQSC